MFDTGSALLYVLTDKCEGALCPQEVKYSPSGSASFRAQVGGDDTGPLAHCYGKGCVSGEVARDQVCFSGDKGGQCMATTLLAVQEATDIEKDKFSGIVGLGPRSDVGRMPAFVE